MARQNQFPLNSPPAWEHVSLNLDQVGARFGLWMILSPVRVYTRGWSGVYVEAQCTGCGKELWTHYGNLRCGASTACADCGHERQIPQWLWQRLAAARQRCTNSKDRGWNAYGGRGIEFRFGSVTEAGVYAVEKLGLPDRSMQIDRINNDGHYERGNLRWATQRQNARNTQRCKHPEWNPALWPYSKNVVYRYLAKGMSRQDVLIQAQTAVDEKRKNWRGIAEKLASMTL